MNRKDEFATKSYVNEAVDAILEGMERMFKEQNARLDRRFEAIDKRFEAIDKRFEAIDKRFEAIDNRFEKMNKSIKELKLTQNLLNSKFDDFGLCYPTREEFDSLKRKVFRHHPTV